MDIGAVGLNLEDSTGDYANPLFDKALQQDKIRAIREMSNTVGIHLVINARTDVVMNNGDYPQYLLEAINRGNAYKEAGADCIFIPDVGNLGEKSISILVKEIDAPINLIAGATLPSISELQEMGVSRVSVGSRPMRAMLSFLRRIAREFMTKGTYELMSESFITYSDVNEWFMPKKDVDSS